MLSSIPFAHDSDIEALFLQPQTQESDYQKVQQFIQIAQPYMDDVYQAVQRLAEREKYTALIPAIQFVYKLNYNQIKELFQKIDNAYEANPSQELEILLRQCSQLRTTAAEICSLLRQMQPQKNVSCPDLTDEEFNAWVEATIQYYGE